MTAIGPAGWVAPRSRVRAWLAIGLVIVIGAASLVNAWRYTSTAANPVVTDDAWYFLDAFVARQLDGSLTWRDFFAKRDATDHSQPLHKLWLAANTRWFGLDFRLDALVAFAGLIACTMLVVAIGVGAAWGRGLRLADGLALSALPLLLFSLNSQEIYEWPLVTQYYLVLPFALLLFLAASRSPRPVAALVFVAALVSLVALDGGGVLAGLAAMLAIVLRAIRGRDWRSARPSVIALVAALAVYHAAWALFLPPPPHGSAAGIVAALQSLLSDPSALWKLFAIPATSSLAHWDALLSQLQTPSRARAAVVLIGVALATVHALFWVSAWRRIAYSPICAFACMLMLYVYGMCAGIVLGRVPAFGMDYLWQYRYIAFFQLANVALVLQWIAATSSAAGERAALRPALALCVALPLLPGLVWLQAMLSDRTWERAPHVRAHYVAMAETIYCLAAHPEARTVECPIQHAVCGWSPEVRVRLVTMLREHRLNVFAPSVQLRYGFHPDPARESVCLASRGPSRSL